MNKCERCGGFTYGEQVDTPSGLVLYVFKCVNCGNMSDDLITKNHTTPHRALNDIGVTRSEVVWLQTYQT